MTYYLDLFSPETAARFAASNREVSGFRIRQRAAASRIVSGDILICYLTKLSRWIGLLEVVGNHYEDRSPIFTSEDDPFVVRFPVRPLVWLPPEQGIPIHEDHVWDHLSFTKERDHKTPKWTGAVRSSLAKLLDTDGRFLADLLNAQVNQPKAYPLDPEELKALQANPVRRDGGVVHVTIPDKSAEQEPKLPASETRESTKIQALLADVGARMGFRIWLPASDRSAVLREAPQAAPALLDSLPLNYDTNTLRTIENIDVLWLKGRSMARAFEIEHTTAIYSGILRMADLLALQPNMDIRLHIAAPEERKLKVFDEIQRPVFSLLEGKPLAERCTFLSYDSIRELAQAKHLEHLSDSVLEDYEEQANI